MSAHRFRLVLSLLLFSLCFIQFCVCSRFLLPFSLSLSHSDNRPDVSDPVCVLFLPSFLLSLSLRIWLCVVACAPVLFFLLLCSSDALWFTKKRCFELLNVFFARRPCQRRSPVTFWTDSSSFSYLLLWLVLDKTSFFITPIYVLSHFSFKSFFPCEFFLLNSCQVCDKPAAFLWGWPWNADLCAHIWQTAKKKKKTTTTTKINTWAFFCFVKTYSIWWNQSLIVFPNQISIKVVYSLPVIVRLFVSTLQHTHTHTSPQFKPSPSAKNIIFCLIKASQMPFLINEYRLLLFDSFLIIWNHSVKSFKHTKVPTSFGQSTSMITKPEYLHT